MKPRMLASKRRAALLSMAIMLMLSAPFVGAAQTLYVDDNAAPGGNGTAQFPFNNLPGAVAAARTLPGSVVIAVAPGDYPLTSTLVIDRSLVLVGSTQQLAQDHWPSGQVVPGTATRVFALNPGVTLPQLVRVGRADSSVLSNVNIRGFVFEGSVGGVSLLMRRVQNYWIADNVFRAPANFAVQSVASSGLVSGNHFSGVGTGTIFNGGYTGSPSNVVFQGNRAVHNTIGGVLLNGASIDIPELGNLLNAVVRDNDLSENTGMQGFGVRAFIIRRDPGAEGDSQSAATVQGVVQSNRMVGNRVGIYIDAGFPYRTFGSGNVCDSRVYSGTMFLQFAGNTLSGSLVRSGLITFTRQQAAIDPLYPAGLAQNQYLHGATFAIQDQDRILSDAWIDHPETDPFLGTCPGDATNEVLGNLLIYNGAVVSNRRNFTTAP